MLWRHLDSSKVRLAIEKSIPTTGTTSTILSAIKFKKDVRRLHWMFLREITPICWVFSLLNRDNLKPPVIASYISNSILSSSKKLLEPLCLAALIPGFRWQLSFWVSLGSTSIKSSWHILFYSSSLAWNSPKATRSCWIRSLKTSYSHLGISGINPIPAVVDLDSSSPELSSLKK